MNPEGPPMRAVVVPEPEQGIVPPFSTQGIGETPRSDILTIPSGIMVSSAFRGISHHYSAKRIAFVKKHEE